MSRTAIFVGSFDPFTIGHADIVRRALLLADHLVIGVGVNDNKKQSTPAEERINAIAKVYANNPHVEVKGYAGLTVDFARSVGAQYVVKGVRSVKDFEYEREQADINRLISGLETVLLCASPHLASISSTMVRTLALHGKDITPYLATPDQQTTDTHYPTLP